MTTATPDLTSIRIEWDADVVVATIDHPDSPVNAIDGRLHDDLAALVAWLRDTAPGRAVLLTARGNAFSAGGDIGWFPQLQDPTVRDHVHRTGRRLIWDLLDVEIPVVAAVQGPAVGLGATIVLLCDAIFMAEDAGIGDPHVRVGLAAGDGGTAIWPLAVGPALAKRYLLTGDLLTADQAWQIGLVTDLVPADALYDDALAFAHRLAAMAPMALRSTKHAVNLWVKQALAVAFDVATNAEIATMVSRDHREAVEAWRDGRRPHFRGN